MIFKRLRIPFLIVFALLATWSVTQLPKLYFDFDFAAFLPPNDPELDYYNRFKNEFKANGSTVYIGVHNEAGAFRKDFVDKVQQLTLDLRKVPDIAEVTSLPVLKDLIWDEKTPIREKVLDRTSQETLSEDSVQIMNDPRFVNSFVSGTGKTMMLVAITDSSKDFSGESFLTDTLSAMLPKYGFDSYQLAGFPIARTMLKRQQQSQFRLYTIIAAIVLAISMGLLFRRVLGILVAVGTVMLGALVFFGLYASTGRAFDLMGTLFPILLTIVGTSDVVHIMTKYVDERRKGLLAIPAISVTIREIGLATFLTSATTAVGLASLFVSRMPPIKYFGLFAAGGVLIAFITVILFTSSVLSFMKPQQVMGWGKKKDIFVNASMWFYRVTKHQFRNVWIGLVVVMGLSAWGISMISQNLHETRDFPYHSSLKQDFLFLDKEFNGVNSVSLAVTAAEGRKLSDIEVQAEMDKLEGYFEDKPIWGPVWSPMVIYRLANRFYNGNNPEFYRPAANKEEYEGQMKLMDKFFRDLIRSVENESGTVGHVSVKVTDIGSQEVAKLTSSLMEWIAQNIDPKLLTVRQTGSKYLFDTNQEYLVKNLLQSLGLAFLIVSIFMAMVFRNLKMVIISLIPNIVPLVVAAGLIGFLGFELDPKIAIVFTIAFGIAVDDTIHFLSRFKIERDKGHTVEESIRHTFQETGKAIIITSILLFSGFITLVWSAFPPTFIIGFLIAITLGVAMFADFFLLPVLLRLFFKDKQG